MQINQKVVISLTENEIREAMIMFVKEHAETELGDCNNWEFHPSPQSALCDNTPVKVGTVKEEKAPPKQDNPFAVVTEVKPTFKPIAFD